MSKQVSIGVKTLQGTFTWHPRKAGDTKTVYVDGQAVAVLTFAFEEKRTPSMYPTLTKRLSKR